ncbi:hypothetical protein AB0N65_12350 [Paenarthrobacter sp. NPDC089322]|uniref:hypothetical protein n=1 Tax=Paenarthrobacter sp. NPDC089322 TaxID=3155065 RepID=UPI00342406A1
MTEPNTAADANVDTAAEGPDIEWPEAAGSTGDASVDSVLGVLETVRTTPVAEHAELYTAIHDSLMEALDAEPGLPPAANPASRPEGTN